MTGRTESKKRKRLKKKASFYFGLDMVTEMQAVADLHERNLSWVLEQSWRLARKKIMKFPSANQGEIESEDLEG